MFTYRSFVRINQAAVIGITSPGGEGYRWFKRHVEVPAGTLAQVNTPVRKGTLRAGNFTEMGANQSGLWVTLGNTADHATYVHEGTDGPIFPRGEFLLLGRQSLTGPGYPRFMYARSVSGQRSQPWLAESMAEALQSAGFYANTTTLQRW